MNEGMLWAAPAGLFGLLIGSFLNVCIYRLPRDLSLVYPARSFCPRCGRTIRAVDNIPVLSWIALRGRCRACSHPISWRYPAIEALTGVLFALAAGAGIWSSETLPLLLFTPLLIVLFFTDLETRILPDECTIGGAAAGWLLALLAPREGGLVSILLPAGATEAGRSLAASVLGGLLPAGGLWLVGELYRLIRRRDGLGFGDVKMLLMLGAFLGLESTFLVVIVASVAGSLAGLMLFWRQGSAAATYELPFGSFLAVAALALTYGPLISHIYWGMDSN